MNFDLLSRLFRENFQKHYGLYGAAIISMLFTAAATSASAWIMKDVVNNIISSQNVQEIFIIACTIAVIFIIKGCAIFSQSYFLNHAGNSIIAEQQLKIYDYITKQSVSFYNGIPSSDLLVRVTQGAQAARGVIDSIVTTFVRDLFSLIGLFTVMLFQNFWLTIGAFTIGPIAFLAMQLLVKRVRKLATKEMLSINEIMKIIQETSIGIRVIKTFSLEPLMQQRMQKAVYDVRDRSNKIATLQALSSPIMETLAGLTIAALVAFSGIFIAKHGSSIGNIIAFITALLLAYEPAKRLVNVRINLESGLVGTQRLFELLDHPITLQENEDAQNIPDKKENTIEFKNVYFRYQEDTNVLKNINFKIKQNEIVALVGPSGSGKSTLVSLMMRLYDPTQGTVAINDLDLRQTTMQSLRDKISYVGQDSFLFNGTIGYNISLGRTNASFDDIVHAAKQAYAHDFIMTLPDGYNTEVGDNGNRLSGGQKQRISIARAILRNSPILILDEATSALDAQTENLFQDALDHLIQDKTCIIIAHRFSTITRADKIIVLENGEIVEEGSREALLKNQNLFRQLHDLQFNNT